MAVMLIFCFYPIVFFLRIINFLWDFNDSWYKKEFPKGQAFYKSKNETYLYKTALDFILDRKFFL